MDVVGLGLGLLCDVALVDDVRGDAECATVDVEAFDVTRDVSTEEPAVGDPGAFEIRRVQARAREVSVLDASTRQRRTLVESHP